MTYEFHTNTYMMAYGQLLQNPVFGRLYVHLKVILDFCRLDQDVLTDDNN